MSSENYLILGYILGLGLLLGYSLLLAVGARNLARRERRGR